MWVEGREAQEKRREKIRGFVRGRGVWGGRMWSPRVQSPVLWKQSSSTGPQPLHWLVPVS